MQAVATVLWDTESYSSVGIQGVGVRRPALSPDRDPRERRSRPPDLAGQRGDRPNEMNLIASRTKKDAWADLVGEST